MSFAVLLNRKVEKAIRKLPLRVAMSFRRLQHDLESTGPVQPSWLNYSKLGKNTYHCHLSYHWVAVWKHEKGTIVVEVTYVGSREGAPY